MFLKPTAFKLLAQMAGYIQTLGNDGLDWLDGAIEATTDFLALPSEAEQAQTHEELLQINALLFEQKRTEPEMQYISDLLGIYYSDISQYLSNSAIPWLQELDNLGNQFAEFIGQGGVNVLVALDNLLMLPCDILEYPIGRLDTAITSISRYAQVLGDRMLLFTLESLRALYIDLGITEPEKVNLDGLTEELEQNLNGYLDLQVITDEMAELTDEEIEQALADWLDTLEEEDNQQINQIMIERLLFLLEMFGIDPYGPALSR